MLPSILSARLRAVTLVVAALLLAGLAQAGVSAVPRDGWPHLPGAPVQADAAGGACGNWFDNPGTQYDNGDYRAVAGGQFYDNWQQTYTHLNADGSYGNVTLTYSLRICGSTWLSGGTGWNFAGGAAVYSGWFDYSGCGGPNGSATFRGKNGDWLPYFPSEVPSASVNLG